MIASVASTAPNVRPGPEDTAAAALQKQRLEATKQAQGRQAVAASSTDEAAAVVSISKQGAEQATAKAAAPETATAAATATAATDEGLKSNKPALAYEAADTDQDGKISAFEQQSYDFRHPQLRAYDAVAQDGSADPNSSLTTPTDTSA